MSGAFQISREIFDNQIWLNITELRLFLLIIGRATYLQEGTDIAGIHLERGQWLRSYRNLQSDLEYVENNAIKKPGLATIKRAVHNLIKAERISADPLELGTLFTVLNYEKYQCLENYRKTPANSDGTATEQRRNNNNKGNKGKKEYIYTPEFESWYSSWPRPAAKQDSFKNFEKRREEHGLEFILKCSQNYIDEYNSKPADKREFPYQSNNFFGQKAYYLDYAAPKIHPQANVTRDLFGDDVILPPGYE